MSLSTVRGCLLILTMTLHALVYGQVRLSLSDKNASREATAVYRYLQDISGKKILAGQMASEWGFDEIGYIEHITGKLPAIKGMDFIDSDKNEAQVRAAEEWWKSGGIPTIMWHWGAPGKGGGYENSKKEIDIDKCFEKGTPEYNAFWKELDEKAALLEKLKAAKVPVLWRPFHELNGNWFWWGKKGAAQFRRLWITMYDYYVHTKKLDNLIWVLCYTANPDSSWYPGRDYVDIAGADDYQQNGGPHLEMYNKVRSVVGDAMPVPFHECGVPPDPAQCFAAGARWCWFMEWHTNFLQKIDTAYLKYIYANDLVVTRDKLPDILAVYGKR
jgi:hypothetical protein